MTLSEAASNDRSGFFAACLYCESKAFKSAPDINAAEFKVYSQNGEDGILQWILQRLENPVKSFIEFGVENYTESNTRFLHLKDHYSGLVIDGSAANIEYILRDTALRDNLTPHLAFIERDNINAIFQQYGYTGEIGVLSIDVDGNDYWVWEAIDCVSPQIVVCEYNSAFGYEKPVAIEYNPGHLWAGDAYFGASLPAFYHLAQKKGYSLLGVNSTQVNAFFVRNDLAGAFAAVTPAQAAKRNGYWNAGHLGAIAGKPLRDVVTGECGAVGAMLPDAAKLISEPACAELTRAKDEGGLSMTNAHWQQAIQKLLAEAPAGSYGQSSELTPQIRALLPSGSMYEAASPADIRGERSDWLHIDARGFDDDQLYEALEHSIFYAQAVWISECENAAGKCLAIAYIIHKYRMLIGSAAQYPSSGHCFITLSDGVKSKTGAASHRELAGEYDSAYYLKDCGGYETFISGQGQKLDDRLRGLMRLVQSGPHASALDIGCGRGELACALYKAGASVLAVDYSEDAIRLAEKTYEAYICERLQYLNINVLDLPETQKFDCIVMSDVVEHIEDASLRLIFAKIARLLSPSGRLIIHTAPNKLVYTLDYPKRREAARNIGLFLPPNPRSYYEERMHINEQTPDSLENALKSCFAHVIVWTGIAASVLRRDGAPGEPHDMSIYAMASNEPISREALSELLDNRLDQSLVNVALECEEQAVTAAAGAEITLRLSLKNLGAQALSSDLPYPAHVTYHIFDQGGNVVVHDGVRTQLPNPLEPGAQAQVSARVLLPADLKGGRAYSIGVTLVQEGRFWFDTLSERFITHIPLTAIE